MAMSGKADHRITEGRTVGSVLYLFVSLFVSYSFAANLLDSAAGKKLIR